MANLAEQLFRRIDALEKSVAELQKARSDTSLDFLTKDTQSKTEDVPKETLTKPLAKLVVALKAHKADFDNSKLAELARELYDSAKLKHVVLAWAHQHKEPWVTKGAKARKNAQIQSWMKRQEA